MKLRNNYKFESRYILITILYSLWGFLISPFFPGNTLVYLMAAFFTVGFVESVLKYGSFTSDGSSVKVLWIIFFIYMLFRYFLGFQLQWFTYWLPPLAVLIVASRIQIEKYLPYKILIFSAFFAVVGIFVQIMLPGPYYSTIAPYLSQGHDIGAIEWVEEGHGYAGFTYQLGVTSIILTFGLASFFSFRDKFMNKYGTIIFYVLFILLIAGVLLSGKRTLSAVDVVIPVLLIFIKQGNKKTFLLLPVLFIITFASYTWFMSHLNTLSDSAVFGRLANSIIDSQAGESAFDTREGLYLAAISAFHNNPLWGIGDFKAYAGLDTDVHNAYLQVLCERGIIGFVLFVVPLLWTLIKTISLYTKQRKGEYDDYIQFSLFLQFVFVLYSFTGNTTIDMSCYFMYFLAVAVYISVNYSISRLKKRKL